LLWWVWGDVGSGNGGSWRRRGSMPVGRLVDAYTHVYDPPS
jgi:hypothetical protein